MNRALLLQSIEAWDGYYRKRRDTLVARAHPILPPVGLASVLIGIRHCGKTSLAIVMSRALPADRVLYYNFEDPLFVNEQGPEGLSTLLDIGYQYRKGPIELLLLDEIHNVPGWERWLRTIIDQGRHQVVVTGSSAKMLSSEIASSLTGRCLQHTVWPLSYGELIDFSTRKPDDRRDNLALFSSYMALGGMPEVVKQSEAGVAGDLLEQYLSDILLKDVVQRHQIRNPRLLRQLVIYYFTSISSLHSHSALGKAFGVGSDTVSLYTEALQEAFLLFSVERYHANLKVQSRDPRKMYCIDLGLREVIARSPSDDTGKKLENLVYLELRRRGLEVMYYKEQQEVDFVVIDHYQPVAAIQVCATMASAPETRRREVNALKECLRSLQINQAMIISADEDELISEDGFLISVVSAWRWMRGDGPEIKMRGAVE